MFHVFKILPFTSLIVILSCTSGCIERPEPYAITPSSTLGIDYDPVICLAKDEIVDNHVPARDFKAWAAKSGGTLGDFEVTYNGFPPLARIAFQNAVDIWDMLLDSDAKIVVSASFADLNSGVLGSAAPTEFYVNFSSKAEPNIEYAAPLAEKIAGANLNRTDPDISCSFSNTVNWYYDFENPELIGDDQFDFVTVVLHELGHGLGFLSRRTFASSSRNGFIGGVSPIETDIFSLLLEEGIGTNLLLTYEDGSNDLGEALLSGDVFFDSHTVPRNPLPEIFAPDPWNSGSSLSHLDESSHGGVDALMTPTIGRKEIIHDPAVALEMMYDMGWKTTFIAHDPINQEISNAPIPITADVFTDEGVGFDSANVKVVISQDSFVTVLDTLVMANTGQSSRFDAQFPAVSGTERFQYYIFLDDTINQQLSSPKVASQRFYNILVGVDDDDPIIDHNPIPFYFLDDEVPTVSATILDEFTGINEVELVYRVNDEPIQSSVMPIDSEGNYSKQFELNFPSIGPDDSISYSIIAKDNAMVQNISSFPTTGFLTIDIKSTPDAVDYYFNDFNTATADFTSETFSVREEDGFDDAALHSEHPYINAGSGNELNFIAKLRVPIKVVEEGMIEFDEVVLVEPGEPNTSYGAQEFWDYVIVEASKDNGGTWIQLADGYDSSSKSAWRSRYDAGIDGANSTSSADKDLLARRSIPLHLPARGINIDDQVILRWRMYSDAFAVGWGWVIDNLEIQKPDNTTPLIEIDQFNEEVLIFPNPVSSNKLNISILGELDITSYLIADRAGNLILNKRLDPGHEKDWSLDISQFPSGEYYLVLRTEDIWITKPFIKL